MIEAIAALAGHLSDIIAEVGQRLSYSYQEISENSLLGGADTQTYLLCMRWDWVGSWGTTWGERWWADVYRGDMATYHVTATRF